MKSRVIRICEGCAKGIAYSFMVGMGGIIVYGISFAFWHLVSSMFS
jgi:hypothetical protein